MTAMISGPRYGSTSELLRAADATRSRARRQYRAPLALFPEREKRMSTRPQEGPPAGYAAGQNKLQTAWRPDRSEGYTPPNPHPRCLTLKKPQETRPPL